MPKRSDALSDGTSWKTPLEDIDVWCHRPSRSKIVELDVIRSLVARDILVVSTGGGGIPVERVDGQLMGVEAVIDKDRASALLAVELAVDLFAISTDTDFVYLNHKRPDQMPLSSVTVSELEQYHLAGHFPPGNMGPKVESVIHFLRSGGQEAVITSFEHLCDAVQRRAGTHIACDATPKQRTTATELEAPVLR